MKRSVFVTVVLVLAACHPTDAETSAAPAQPQIDKRAAVFHTNVGDATVEVELAIKPNERSRGLMFKKELAPNRGMLFVFPEEKEQPFWMKNTYISLDMIFIDSSKRVVGVVANAEPLSEKVLTIGKPAKYVVEVSAGFAKDNGVTLGTAVSLPELPTDVY